jgi:RNA polymerase sigma-70 factor (ECF subfamily)
MQETSMTLLIRAAQAGCKQSLGLLLDMYRPFLMAIARDELDGNLKAKANPSDLVQQTFIEAQRDLSKARLDEDKDLRAWLRKLLVNNIADFRQSYHRGKRSVSREKSVEELSSPDYLGNLATANSDTPSQDASRREDLARVEAALNRLSSAYRQVIVWRNREHLSMAEIALRLDRSQDAVRVLWARAIVKLKKELDHGNGCET